MNAFPGPTEKYIPTAEATISSDIDYEFLAGSSLTKEEQSKIDEDVMRFGKYTLYEVCIYKFIAIEGIVLSNYYCAAGYKTFGIGCVNDTPEERALIASGLTYPKVRQHLEKEFLHMIDVVEKDAPGMYKTNEKAALAMLFLSIGYERFWSKNQRHKKGYVNGLGISRAIWLAQCNYKSSVTGKYVRSDHIYSSKVFEVDLFFNNKKSVEHQADKFRKTASQLQKRLKVWQSNLSEAGYTPLLQLLV